MNKKRSTSVIDYARDRSLVSGVLRVRNGFGTENRKCDLKSNTLTDVHCSLLYV